MHLAGRTTEPHRLAYESSPDYTVLIPTLTYPAIFLATVGLSLVVVGTCAAFVRLRRVFLRRASGGNRGVAGAETEMDNIPPSRQSNDTDWSGKTAVAR
jgi:hypothetical protein